MPGRRGPDYEVPTDPLAPYRMTPLIQRALVQSSVAFWQERERANQEQVAILTGLYGPSGAPPFRFSPSVVSVCNLKQIFTALNYPRTPRTFEAEMALQLGSSAHYVLLRPLRNIGWQEQSFVTENPPMSGRVDFLFYNSALDEWQILDLKVTSSFGFRQLKRDNLREYMKQYKNIYPATPEAEKQMLLYMYALRQQGKNVTSGSILTINRDNFAIKERIILMNQEAEERIADLMSIMEESYPKILHFLKLQKAGEEILQSEFPESSVDPLTSHYICGFCDFGPLCDVGRLFAEKKRKRSSKRYSPHVYRQIKAEGEARRKKVQDAGFTQPPLPNLD